MTSFASSRMPLPLLRRELKPDEWPESYLASVVRENGVRRPWRYHIELIRDVLPWYRVDGQETAGIDQVAWSVRRDARPRYGQAPFPKWASCTQYAVIRYCPLCLVDQRYVRARWRLLELPVCTLHGCYLKTNLAEPALTVGYKREDRLHLADATDEQLLVEAVCCLPQEFRHVRDVWAPFERAAEASVDPYTDDALGHLAAWTLLAWRLIEKVTRAHTRQVRKATSHGLLADIVLLFADASLTMAPSREGVQRFLLGLRENVHFKAALNCLRQLMTAEQTERTVLSGLPLAELHDALVAAAPHLPVGTKPGELVFRDERSRAISRSQALDELGVSERLFDDWIRNGKIRQIDIRRLGAKRFIFVGREDVRRVRRLLLSLVNVEDFLTEHGTDWPTYFALRKEGLVHPVQMGDRRYLARSELLALSAQLELLAAPMDTLTGIGVPLFNETMVERAVRQTNYGDLVRAALDGRFPVYRNLAAPGLSSFVVDVQAMAWLRSRRRWRRDGTGSVAGLGQPSLFEPATA